MFITALVIFVAVELPLTAWAVMRLIRAGASHRIIKGPLGAATPVVPNSAPRADEISEEELVPVSPDLITRSRVGGYLSALGIRLFFNFEGMLFFIPLKFDGTSLGSDSFAGPVASMLGTEGDEDAALAKVVERGLAYGNLPPPLWVPLGVFAHQRTVLFGAAGHVRPDIPEPIPVPRVVGRVWVNKGRLEFGIPEAADHVGVLVRHTATGEGYVLGSSSEPVRIPSRGITTCHILGFTNGTLMPIPSKIAWEIIPRYSRTWHPDRRRAS